MRPPTFVTALCLLCCSLTSCSRQPIDHGPIDLTQEADQQNIVAGKTTKAEILEFFGPPNITTRDSAGHEVWTYQRNRQSTIRGSSSDAVMLFVFGANVPPSELSNTSRTATLIIKFDQHDVVSGFRSRQSTF